MKNQQGFTVIELIVYMALFSLVIGGLLLTTYSIVESNGRLQSKVLINEEGAFLLRKIDWALNGATSVSVPAPDELRIANPDVGNTIFRLNGQNLDFTRAGNTSPLNSESVQVEAAVFSYDSTKKIVGIGITLKNLSQTQVFEVTRYLRQ